jgi:CheY-like chemotaxis protein
VLSAICHLGTMQRNGSSSPLLVVADYDAELRSSVTGFLAGRGYEVCPAEDVDAARTLLRTVKVDVLISDLALRGGGLELLSFARESGPTRAIAIAAAATVHDREAALRLGAVRVLAKPLSLIELAEAVGVAHDWGEGFHGWMHRLSLVDVLQMYHQTAQSLLLHVAGGVAGTIAMRHGELVHAECPGAVGTAALVQLLSARSGRLDTSPLIDTERTIEATFDHVILDGLRALDESRRGPYESTMPTMLDDWFDESTAQDAERELLVQWLAEHAPGAALWRVDPAAPSLDRIDTPGSHPEQEIGGTLGSIGWAYDLAEAGDPTWTRVELVNGPIAVALVRAGPLTLAFARIVTGDAMLRQFHLEAARLASWVARYREGGR